MRDQLNRRAVAVLPASHSGRKNAVNETITTFVLSSAFSQPCLTLSYSTTSFAQVASKIQQIPVGKRPFSTFAKMVPRISTSTSVPASLRSRPLVYEYRSVVVNSVCNLVDFVPLIDYLVDRVTHMSYLVLSEVVSLKPR